LREVLALAREVGNRKEEGWALVYLGNCDIRQDRTEAAMDRYRQAIDVFRAIDFHTGLCIAYSHLGEAMRRTGRLADCLRYQELAIEANTRVGGAIPAGVIMFRMGQTLAAMGRLQEAVRRYSAAVEGFSEAGHIAEVGRALYSLALVQIELGDSDAAVTSLESAVRIFREIRDLPQQATALRTLGETMKDRSEDGTALAYEREAAAILAELEVPTARITSDRA
jgi:tetratricopeptide (TPR) repeat protein